jgi:hypothetical protein
VLKKFYHFLLSLASFFLVFAQSEVTINNEQRACWQAAGLAFFVLCFRTMLVRAGQRAGKKFIGFPAGRDETKNATRMQSNK